MNSVFLFLFLFCFVCLFVCFPEETRNKARPDFCGFTDVLLFRHLHSTDQTLEALNESPFMQTGRVRRILRSSFAPCLSAHCRPDMPREVNVLVKRVFARKRGKKDD